MEIEIRVNISRVEILSAHNPHEYVHMKLKEAAIPVETVDLSYKSMTIRVTHGKLYTSEDPVLDSTRFTWIGDLQPKIVGGKCHNK